MKRRFEGYSNKGGEDKEGGGEGEGIYRDPWSCPNAKSKDQEKIMGSSP